MDTQNWIERLLSPNLAVCELNVNDCPNCWGFSQWEKEKPAYFSLDKGQCSEVSSRNGFIRRFVKRYIG